ncbi:MAG: T9SS type A sorting domain-containing protein [Candidatus Kapaibacterium sp.]
MKNALLIAIVIILGATALSAQYKGWTYFPEEAIGGNGVRSIAIDESAGISYFIVYNSYSSNFKYFIMKYQNGEFAKISTDEFDYPFGESVEVVEIASDNNGGLWAITSQHILRFDGTRWSRRQIETDLDYERSNKAMAVDKNNIAWISSDQNKYKGEHQGTKFYEKIFMEIWKISDSDMEIVQKTNISDTTKEQVRVSDLATDSKGNLWAISDPVKYGEFRNRGTLRKFDGEWQAYEYPEITAEDEYFFPQDMYIDAEDNVWVIIQAMQTYSYGARPGSFLIYDGEGWSHKTVADYTLGPGASMTWMSNIIIDRSGILWYSLNSRGLYRIENDYISSFPLGDLTGQNEYYHGGCHAMAELPDGKIWFGTNRGLFMYDPMVNSVGEIPGSELINIYPNPAVGAGNITIDLSANFPDSQINIYDITGKLALSGKADESGVYTIPAKIFAKGTYSVIIRAGGKAYFKKLVICE